MDNKQTSRGGAGRGQGRKPLVEGSPMVPVSLKMTVDQKEKLARLGGAPWVRGQIDEAPEPVDPSPTPKAE